MVPEFNIKQVDTKLSNDVRAHITSLLYVLSVIAFYVLTKGIHHQVKVSDIIGFSVGIGLVIIQGVTRFLPITKNWSAFNSGGIGALILYNVAIADLLIWFVPLYSPFVLIITPVMFITIYYRGEGAYIISLATIILLVLVATIKSGTPSVPYSYLYPYFTIVLLGALGGLFSRAGSVDEQIRTEFHRISQRVELEREQLASLVDSMSDSVLATDQNGKILFHNRAALNLLGEKETLIDKNLLEFISIYNATDKRADIFVEAKKRTGRTTFSDLHFITRNNDYISLYVDISPILSKFNKDDQGYIVLLRDVTKERTLDQQKNEFISVTSHELRTPVTVVEASVSMLQSPNVLEQLNPDAKVMVKKAHENILYLSELINTLSLFSNIELNRLTNKQENVNVADVVERLTRSFEDDVKAKNLHLTQKIPLGLPAIVTNEEYFYEILKSFMSNAVKYTTEGMVSIEVTDSNPDFIVVDIKDTGIGIGDNDKDKIFSRYYRSEDYQTSKTKGTGLGLYLAKKLSEYLGGKVWFESELNRGSVFYLQLPKKVHMNGQPEVATVHNPEPKT